MEWRSTLHTTYMEVLYGTGSVSLSNDLGHPVAEKEEKSSTIFDSFVTAAGEDLQQTNEKKIGRR